MWAMKTVKITSAVALDNEIVIPTSLNTNINWLLTTNEINST